MTGGIPFPDISPELFSIEIFGFTLALRWYALAYIAGILIGWRIAVAAVKRPHLWRDGKAPMTVEQVEAFLTWAIVGIIVGGRLGYVMFYQPAYYLANPAEIPMVWQGGMAFHGGFLGVVVAAAIFSWRHKLYIPSVADMCAISAAPGLLFGRIANFINAELWGRPTTSDWGVIFPGAEAQTCPGFGVPCARHASQLYEAGLEGLVLGAILLILAFARGWLKMPFRLTGVFIAGYGIARFIVEFFRQADAQFITVDNPLGHVIRLGEAGMSMGQLLSLPMVAVGVLLIVAARRKA